MSDGMAPTIKTGLALNRLGMPFFRESKDVAQKFTNDQMAYLSSCLTTQVITFLLIVGVFGLFEFFVDNSTFSNLIFVVVVSSLC